jgi:hypothetical protein
MRPVDLRNPSRAAPEPTPRGLFEGELMDLYAAILIVVPLALFLKSLWF